MKILFTLISLILVHLPLYGIHLDSIANNKPTITASRVTNPIVIDGILSEQDWQKPGISDFTQRDPIEGAKPTFKTEVWVSYDDEAIYVAARMYDDHPDSIVSRVGRRDAEMSSDFFAIAFDSYHDHRTGFFFGVYPSGSILDGILFNDSRDDKSWDAVWDVGTQTDNNGWTAELKIPYSQLRFSEQKEYTWGVNIVRGINRYQEEDWFVMIPKKESGFVSHFADLIGIKNIHPPSRIEILPYAVSSLRLTNQYEKGDPFNKSSKFTGNAGADFKIGLGSNLTLNATINPDFGQVEVDPAVVNLSQYETFFDEKRPFFVDGSNYFNFGTGGSNYNYNFNWGNPDFFYSRRIGRTPQGEIQHDGYNDFPNNTTILGASKITGRIRNGWSFGLINSITEREYAIIEDENANRYKDVVEPLTSQNIIRSLYEFNSGHQALGFIATGVLRDLNQPYLLDQFNRRSYAFGIDGWTKLDAEKNYVITGWIATSRIEGSSKRITDIQESYVHYFQRPDQNYVKIDSSLNHLTGYAGRITFNKEKGNIILNTAFGFITPGFDVNDLGFQFRTNILNSHIVLGYRWLQPDGTFRRKSLELATFRSYDFSGNKFGEGYYLFSDFQLMNYWNFFTRFSMSQPAVDLFSTRGGPSMINPRSFHSGIEMSTDSRDPIVYELELNGARSESGGFEIEVNPKIEWKPTPSISCQIGGDITRGITTAQWIPDDINPVIDSTAILTYGKRYLFSKLDQKEISAKIRLDWTFTPRLSLQIFIQPLISGGNYYDFKELAKAGTFTFNRYGENNTTIKYIEDEDAYVVTLDSTGSRSFSFTNPNFNYKSIRLNAVLRWEFLPGSTAYLVWTRAGEHSGDAGQFKLYRDFGNLLKAPDHEDIFLLKIAYWISP